MLPQKTVLQVIARLQAVIFGRADGLFQAAKQPHRLACAHGVTFYPGYRAYCSDML